MYQKIFVAVDLEHEASAKKSIHAARQLGGESAQYIIASVLPFSSSSMVSNYLPKDYRKRVKDEVHARLDELVMTFQWQDNVKTEIYSGSIYEELTDEAKALHCDVLLIGSGRNGHGLGGNAQRVAQFFNQSVLIVR